MNVVPDFAIKITIQQNTKTFNMELSDMSCAL